MSLNVVLDEASITAAIVKAAEKADARAKRIREIEAELDSAHLGAAGGEP